MKNFFQFLKHKPLAYTSFVILCILYFIMIFADFFAVYRPEKTYENNTFHPANVQLTLKGIKVREFRVIEKSTWTYVRVKDKETVHNFKFFAKGFEYKILGLIPCNLHLFGADSDYPLYILGADNLGRDLYSRIVYGSRISLTIGFVATFISLFLAVLFGGISGYFGGKTDWAIMRFAEFFMLIPSLYFILFLRSLLNNQMDSGTSYMIITLILSLIGWPGSARTIRGLVHSIKNEEFVLNAKAEGVPVFIIIFKYIVPQTSSLLIVSTALSIPGFIMSETTLSYLGLGINDPAVSWGSLINRDISTVSNLVKFPWLLYPVLLLLIVTLSFNFFADALRDYFDPYAAVFKRKNKKSVKLEQNLPKSEKNSSVSQKEKNLLLSVENLSVSFEVLRNFAKKTIYGVQNVSFYVKKGEILGIVGESGSGKSVSTSAIPCLLPENAFISGKIFYDGINLFDLPEKVMRSYRGKKIALIFQEPGCSFDPLQNIKSVFFETFKNLDSKITKENAWKKSVSLLNEVGIPDAEKRLNFYPHQFSGGQLQRLCIALALAQNCELLIADEPTTALDVTIQAQIISLLLRLKKERALSIIFISHDINLVSKISDRIIVMYGGKIMEEGAAEKIMNNPSHPYTQAL
ncbi:MAG: ATP-binding cassette domain-containing protein, partial [Spirochaetia bacterium]|nr:ATP-binding cassette domain-containing protein [Spirochaetia bacterium]